MPVKQRQRVFPLENFEKKKTVSKAISAFSTRHFLKNQSQSSVKWQVFLELRAIFPRFFLT